MLGIGSDQGVQPNDPVIAPASDGGALVGRRSRTSPEAPPTVQVLLDPAIGVTATVQGRAGRERHHRPRHRARRAS